MYQNRHGERHKHVLHVLDNIIEKDRKEIWLVFNIQLGNDIQDWKAISRGLKVNDTCCHVTTYQVLSFSESKHVPLLFISNQEMFSVL